MENLLTPDELVAILKVPKSWLYGRIHAGTLHSAIAKSDTTSDSLNRLCANTSKVRTAPAAPLWRSAEGKEAKSMTLELGTQRRVLRPSIDRASHDVI
jgi:hypothetical protein